MISIAWQLAIAIALGALIGLEREIAQKGKQGFGGVRTYTFYALIGALCGVINNPQITIITLLGVIILAGISYYATASKSKETIDLVPELSAILSFMIGILTTTELMPIAVTLAVIITTILALKQSWKNIAKKISREEVYSTIEFLIVILVILPLLPNHQYSPLDVPIIQKTLSISPTMLNIAWQLDIFNPRNVWLMVVFVSSISFIGYALVRMAGPNRGIILTSTLGGIVSSTAVTTSLSNISKNAKTMTRVLTLGIILASTIMFARVLLEVAVINPTLLLTLAKPIGAMMITGIIIATYLYIKKEKETNKTIQFTSPFTIKPALVFGLFYLLVLFTSKLLLTIFSNTGAYIASAISGIADVDAITLSFSQLATSGAVDNTVAAKAITIAVISNTIIKAGIAIMIGRKTISTQTTKAFSAILIAGIITMILL